MALEVRHTNNIGKTQDIKTIQKILKKSDRNITQSDKWLLLGNMLSNFGAEFTDKKLALQWGDKDEQQFELLARMFNSLLNISTTGKFDNGVWQVQV